MLNFYFRSRIDTVDELITCAFNLGNAIIFHRLKIRWHGLDFLFRFSNFLLESIKPAVKMDEIGGTMSDEELMES